MIKIIVSKDGEGDFLSIQEAIDSVRVLSLEPVTIMIKEGVYEEVVTVPDNKPNIKIIGDGKEKTIIQNNRCATMKNKQGKSIGTFKTAVVYAFADNLSFENLTIRNCAGFGESIGQALALYVSGDKCMFNHIALSGNQDTFYSSRGRQYFINSYIEGHVDFIFGSGTVVFDNCIIHSLRKGYITAASTPQDLRYGFVFRNCKLTGEAVPDTVYLGRPWRPYAHTAFINTWMGPHIKCEGWDNWRDHKNEFTSRYYEYRSFGPGAHHEQRVQWSKMLSDQEAKQYSLDNIFHQANDWIPNTTEIEGLHH